MKINLPSDVSHIISTLEARGFSAYAVGGCVRDSLLSRTPKDWDITTDAKPEEVKALFRRTVDTGIEHGTVTVLFGKRGYEITTFRIDGRYEDSRHPESVTFTPSLEEDLRRRDFTINAMAYNDTAGLVDIFGGMEDLERGTVRAVGDPEERFTEDALRIMRCIRFGAELGYNIDPETLAAAKKLSGTIAKISRERVREELLKILLSDHPDDVGKLSDIGVLGTFYPEFEHGRQHMTDVLLRTPTDRIYRLVAFLHASGETVEDSYEIGKRVLLELRFDNDTKNRVLHMIRFHARKMTPDRTGLRHFLSDYGKEDFGDLITYVECDHREDLSAVRAVYEDIVSSGECTSIRELQVTGEDLAVIGIPRGKAMGEVLKKLLDRVLDEPALNTKDTLLSMAAAGFFSF